MKRVLIIAAVAFVVGTGVGIAAAADPVESSEEATANITAVEVDDAEGQFTVKTDSSDTDRIRVMDEGGSYIHDVDLAPEASARPLPLNWSQYELVECGYATDGETTIVILDEDYNELDRTTVNISEQTQVCQ